MLIFLIGYMGCGKSTIGRKFASRSEFNLIDTDHLIVEREGRSVAEIFEQEGEPYFRALERSVLEELIERGGDYIISTGGGLPLAGDNMEVMNNAGLTIYLYRTAESIASRMSPAGRAKRPKLRGLNDEELVAYMAENIEMREPTYRKAKVTINAVPMGDKEIVKYVLKLSRRL